MASLQWVQNGFGLWVPATQEGRGSNINPNALAFWTIHLGYFELYGSQPTWADVARRLDRYSLRDVLEIVSRLSSCLCAARFEESETVQRQITDALFGVERAQEIWTRVARFRNEHPHLPGVVLFGDLHLINVIKAALLLMPVEDRPSDSDSTALGEAILMIGGLVHQQANPGEPDPGQLSPKWALFLVANALFHKGGNLRNEIARSYELYLRDRLEFAEHHAYVDLPGRVKAVTGIEPRVLWASLFALLTAWRAHVDDGPKKAVGHISASTHLTANYNFSEAEVAALFELCSSSVERLQQRVREDYACETLEPFDVIPFALHPLIRVGDDIYLSSLSLLTAKLVRGLYHALLGGSPTAESRRVLDYMGHVFEDYVARLLRRTYPAESGQYLPESAIQDVIPGEKCCDGILVFPTSLILIECKARLFPLNVRQAQDSEKLREALETMYLVAARQISATIDAIKEGRLRTLGIDPSQIRHYFPLLVSHEDVVMVKLVQDQVLDRAKTEGVLVQEGVRPMQGISIAELEELEPELATTAFDELIATKVASSVFRDQSFRNFCYSQAPNTVSAHNEYLRSVFAQLGEDALRLFQERKRSK